MREIEKKERQRKTEKTNRKKTTDNKTVELLNFDKTRWMQNSQRGAIKEIEKIFAA